MRVEHEYERAGAWAYFASWDVRRAQIYGRCERKTGIVLFSRLVGQPMDQEPYRSAQRVFWIMDNGSSHRGKACIRRLTPQWPTIIPVHTPIHASWRRIQNAGSTLSATDIGCTQRRSFANGSSFAGL